MRVPTGLTILILVLLGARTEVAALPVRVTRDSYDAGGRRIDIEHFEPAEAAAKGAAVVLHGAGGVIFDGPEMRRVAQSLAENGYDVSLIHYFDRTGTLFARGSTMQRNFADWLDTVRKGIEHVRLTRSEGRPIYVYGYSLGGFLAIAAASDNRDVAAVAEHAGGIWNNQKERIGRMPPVLMIHGAVDRRVPFDKYARPLLAKLRRGKGHVATHFYAHEDHGFTPPALREVRREVAQFFDAHRRAQARVESPAAMLHVRR